MFTDERTESAIYADLNKTVSRATMRTQDLIPAFLDVIRDTAEYVQLIVDNQMPPAYAQCDKYSEWWDSEDASWLLNETLFDILNSYAPNGYYFGSHPGDGSDYGYWMTDEYRKFKDACDVCGVTDDGERWSYKGLKYRNICDLIRENGLDYYFYGMDIPGYIEYKYVG